MTLSQLLTGSTGAVGCHILHSLILRPSVRKVYCPIRTKHSTASTTRLDHVLATNHLLDDLTSEQREKIVPIQYDLYSQGEELGISAADYEVLRTSVTIICHNAWAVSYNMKLPDFHVHCKGTYNLINLALRSDFKKKPTFLYISSLGVIAGAKPRPITETLYGLESVLNINYARSKWITEQIIHKATEKTGLETRILRLGQICGDTKHGMWNTKEAWPMVMATARTIGALPANQKTDDEHHWLPSDVTGDVIADIALLDHIDGDGDGNDARASVPKFAIFHVLNPQPTYWRTHVLSALKRNGLDFETLPWIEWADRLEKSDSNLLRNPSYRLMAFIKGWAFRLSETNSEISRNSPAVDMTNTFKVSPRLVKGVSIDDGLIGKFLQYWSSQTSWAGQSSVTKL